MSFVRSVTGMDLTHSNSEENIQAPCYKVGLAGWHPGPGNQQDKNREHPLNIARANQLPPTTATVTTLCPSPTLPPRKSAYLSLLSWLHSG